MKEEFFTKEYNFAVEACLIADENKAENIKLYDISHKTSIADYFVFLTANSNVHAKSLVDNIEEGLQKKDVHVVRREIGGDGRWFVLDYGTFIVHIFTAEIRDHYQIEKLWAEGKNNLDIAGINKMINPTEAKSKAKGKAVSKEKEEPKEKADKKAKPAAKEKPVAKAKEKAKPEPKAKEKAKSKATKEAKTKAKSKE